MKRIIALLFFFLIAFGYSLSPEEEKQLIRDIAEIKATLKTFMEQTDKRFQDLNQRINELREDMNKRFEQVDKRFEQVDKRFEQINNELNRLIQIMVGIFAGQIALVAAVIGFAWWDRRTIIRKSKEETFEEMEKELRPEKFKKLLNALREKAKTDKELEAILKKYGLL
ncbi:hypothetical protein [Aquifex aeolicus]|uniref:Uncharacterized protein aq_1900 n=1 Tax=Aquifex aeolicus (strain VF5) TaxID=224324 RepID=Y1900_AQUAE|nr:hypothetical protein [Aquifex aeolicus]O67738.1 RecName: Full=Uncharacterized protein aq_1900 [Aquifex aeolicus VF5]AAC07710.1 putative protein [Aquifex aeolicus VF5]